MKFNPLKIGDLSVPLPIIQGGMGIGVSLSNLASAVTNSGGIGVISAAQIGFRDKNFEDNALACNLKALKEEIKLAKEKCKNGILGVNIMVATKEYAEHVKAAIEAGIDIIISGAGLPTMLPKHKNIVYVNNLNYNNYNYLIIKIFDCRFIGRLLYYEI